MSLLFRCAACGADHPSRIRGRDRRWVAMYLESCGQVLEQCPVTRDWVKLRPADSTWVPDHAWQGASSPLLTPTRSV